VKFANIEEDTPSYHRRYDFFVSKFSSMCHNSDRTAATRSRYRLCDALNIISIITAIASTCHTLCGRRRRRCTLSLSMSMLNLRCWQWLGGN